MSKPFITHTPVLLKKPRSEWTDWVFLAYAEESFKIKGKCESIDRKYKKFTNNYFVHKYSINIYKLGEFDKKIKWTAEILCENFCAPSKKITTVKFYGQLGIKIGDLFIHSDHRGLGLGSIIWDHFAYWLKNNYPETKEFALDLSAVDAKPEVDYFGKIVTKEPHIRRNNMYKAVGFNLKFIKEDCKNGKAECKNVSQLNYEMNTRGFEIITEKNFPLFKIDSRKPSKINNISEEPSKLKNSSFKKLLLELKGFSSNICKNFCDIISSLFIILGSFLYLIWHVIKFPFTLIKDWRQSKA